MKIRGIGTDIIELERIEKALSIPGFKERIFTPRERKERGKRVESYASAFAAKEAIVKALGTGFRDISFQDIEILHEVGGKPYICLYGEKKENWFISLSHDRTAAIAYVIWQED